MAEPKRHMDVQQGACFGKPIGTTTFDHSDIAQVYSQSVGWLVSVSAKVSKRCAGAPPAHLPPPNHASYKQASTQPQQPEP
jgi:hypothetical protein